VPDRGLLIIYSIDTCLADALPQDVASIGRSFIVSGSHAWFARARRALRPRVGIKFSLAVGAMLVAALAITEIGVVGLVKIQASVDRLIDDNVATLEATAELNDILDNLAATALEEVTVVRVGDADRLEERVDREMMPEAIRGISVMRTLSADDPGASAKLDAIQAGLDDYQALRRTGVYRPSGKQMAPAQADAGLARRTVTLFEGMATASDELRADELAQTLGVGRWVKVTSARTRAYMAFSSGVTLVGALLVVVLLNLNLVPRIRTYARFAAEISACRSVSPLEVKGSDELADLGQALNRMVAADRRARYAAENQGEFMAAMQVTASEDEAHDLLRRHRERALPSSTVTILRRNNSENRLEAMTDLPPGSQLQARLPGAEPRSCLAMRFNRTHREGTGRRLLKTCELCSTDDACSTCEPLLVGGELIGAVLAVHPTPLSADESVAITTTIAQAAPVLANLRNLALADFRANNDALTGLPNRRATEATLKRLVAQANRSVTPLTAVMLDLDHFKAINDGYGHGKGDEVLAAVGAALDSALRASDFAGRYGGEEFLILLPDTSARGGAQLAEKLREIIRSISVPGIDRPITASLGVADLFQNTGGAGSLVREADRALYAAKAAGRDRVVTAGSRADDAEGPRPEPSAITEGSSPVTPVLP
jgi:diguanylate cyclase (GGDEF)-like protein